MGKRVYTTFVPPSSYENEHTLAAWLTSAYKEAEVYGRVISVCKDTVGGGLKPIVPCYVFFLEEHGGEQDA